MTKTYSASDSMSARPMIMTVWMRAAAPGWRAMAFAAGLCGLGQGRAVAAAVDAMARQPGAAARIQTAMIIGLALIESLAIYVLVVAMILLFVQPVK